MKRLICRILGHRPDYMGLDYRGPEPPNPKCIHANSILRSVCGRCGHSGEEWVCVRG